MADTTFSAELAAAAAANAVVDNTARAAAVDAKANPTLTSAAIVAAGGDTTARASASAAAVTANAANVAATTAAVDPVARYIGSRARNVGRRIVGGRGGTIDNSTPSTFQLTINTELKFDAVRIIFSNNLTTTSAIGGCKVIQVTQAADYNRSTGSHTPVTFAGAATAVVPAAPTPASGFPASSRRAFLKSDWILLPSVARSDGGAFPLLSIKAYMTTAGNIGGIGAIGSSGEVVDDYTPWATRADGRRVIMRRQAGDCVTTPASFMSTTNINQCPIVGIEYMARGRVVNVVVFGNSISENRATYLGGGWGYVACADLSSDPTIPAAFEFSCLGWTGQSSQVFLNHLYDDLPYFSDQPFDIGFIPNYSPNDAADNPTNGTTRASAGRASLAAGLLSSHGAMPIIWTGLPTNETQYAIGAKDSFRRAINAEMLTTWTGVTVADFSGAVEDPVPLASGQYQFLPGMTLIGTGENGTHPSDAGNIAMAAVAKPIIKRLSGFS